MIHKKLILLFMISSINKLTDGVVRRESNNRRPPGVVVLDEKLHLMGGTDKKSIQFYNIKSGNFETKRGYMNSSIHYDTQAFVVDTKSINPNNILKYYSSNEI
ncbi:uncharacterized protein LOC107883885 [Acyrthosiphon pisum]|uniref:Uncharacterized protein n=1 Tax=Acyrthosiphon pisum TaxID=7029 RepID=A0A8R2NXG5_ACYPI|nr:uncharacterized protein LOC107883885 [Acyrthosiphon pisum]|eukprot:XP_016660287.1 PREDICTED: uncharacterized protein LOC107883885 [Acyrthosiphon pisum]